ncbi:hypothetical protein F2Q70_00012055 [Brassica cretica]|uniref:Uncharacterized protein n=2 Tax=Brassica cretica TaxID=69181 RepID=A0A3N6SXK0_BRACR|nr:hypothetical protein F2Q68_00005160 [Brassica cretica]KAF2615111.1 hypothetical protein F2Q70_00012055 [Brassica cretica]KAF3545872.1 hypothetical protein DY000_02007820 [Brassica cretica]
MEGPLYRKFSFFRRKGVVLWTGPGILPSRDPEAGVLPGVQKGEEGSVEKAPSSEPDNAGAGERSLELEPVETDKVPPTVGQTEELNVNPS